jgi:hypothetical protein
VPTREELKRLFGVILEVRFRTIMRLIYACGLRVSGAISLEVGDIKRDGPRAASEEDQVQQRAPGAVAALGVSIVAGLLKDPRCSDRCDAAPSRR